MVMRRICVLMAGILLLGSAEVFGSEGMWTDNGIVICHETSAQRYASVVLDSAGYAVIVWDDSRSGASDIYAQRVDSKGEAVWTENGLAVCNAAAHQTAPSITASLPESVIIVWADWQDVNNPEIYAQRIDSSGGSIWMANGVVVCNAGGKRWVGSVVRDGAGGAIVVLHDDRNGNPDIYAQRIDSSGSSIWTANGVVVCNDGNEQRVASAARDGTGGAIIVWRDNRNGNNDIYAQRINSSGSSIWTENGVIVCNEGSIQSSPAIASAGAGGAIIVWEDDRNSSYDIYAQKIDNSGNSIWTANGVVVCNKWDDQVCPAIAPDSANGAIIAWEDKRSSNHDIYAQRLDKDGCPVWSVNGVAICHEKDQRWMPFMAGDDTGGAVIVWHDHRESASAPDIYAQKIIRPRPEITGLLPHQGAWGAMARNINISGSYFKDDLGGITYAKLTRTGEDDITGADIRDLSADSFTCDFDLSSLKTESSWYIVVCDNCGQTGTSSTLFNVYSPEMQNLSWISAQAGKVNTGTRDNLAGQINCLAAGYDSIRSLTVENTGTAESGMDIRAVSLWQKKGGSSGGITFDPLAANCLGNILSEGAKRWKIIFEGEGVKAEDKDALYITVDIAGGAQAGRTCCFSIPAEGALFEHGGNLPKSGLVSGTEQEIARSPAFYLDFLPLAPVNVVEGQKEVRLGQIRISNVAGRSLDINSVLISLNDKAGKEVELDAVFDRLRLKRNSSLAAEISASVGSKTLTLVPPLSLARGQEAVLELAGDIRAVPKAAAFFIGLPHEQCINSGTHLTEAVSGKEFPLLSGQVNIRAPDTKTVFSNYPNPFVASKESTKISYYLKLPGRVKITILGISGGLVKTLVQEDKTAGMHEAEWDGRNENGRRVVSGAYLLKLDVRYADGSRERLMRKMGVMR